MSRFSRRRTSPALLAATSLLFNAVASADTDIYGPASDVAIGRVFLTRAERLWLDRERRRPAATGEAQNAAAPADPDDAASSRRPAGYIISSRGGRQVWAGDEFVAGASGGPSTKRFPGDIEITRHNNEIPSQSDDAADAETETVPAQEPQPSVEARPPEQ